MYAYFNRFEIQMTQSQAEQGSHPGDCSNDIDYLLTLPRIKAQFRKIVADDIKAELKEYGAGDETELSDHEQNQKRILWIAAGNIREELAEKKRSL